MSEFDTIAERLRIKVEHVESATRRVVNLGQAIGTFYVELPPSPEITRLRSDAIGTTTWLEQLSMIEADLDRSTDILAQAISGFEDRVFGDKLGAATSVGR